MRRAISDYLTALTQPSPQIPPHQHLQARLVATIGLLGLSVAIINTFIDSLVGLSPLLVWALLLSFPLFGVVYALGRGRHIMLGAYLATIGMWGLIWLVILFSPEWHMAGLATGPIFLGALLLPTRPATRISLIGLTLYTLTVYLSYQDLHSIGFLTVSVYVAGLSVLIHLSRTIRDQHEQQIAKQAAQAAQYLAHEIAINRLSRTLITDTNPQTAIPNALKYLLDGLKVDRVHILRLLKGEQGDYLQAWYEQDRIPALSLAQSSMGVPIQLDTLDPALRQSIRERRIFVIDSQHPTFGPLMGQADTAYVLCLPIYVHNTPYGVLGLTNQHTPITWTQSDEHLLQIAAEILGGYLERHEAQTTLQQRFQYEAALSQFSLSLIADENPQAAISQALTALKQEIGLQGAFLLRHNADKHALIMQSLSEGRYSHIVQNLVLQINLTRPAFMEAMQERRVYEVDIPYISAQLADKIPVLPLLSILALPVYLGQTWYGVLLITQSQNAYTWKSEERTLLQVAAELLGIYLERNRVQSYYKAFVEALPDMYFIVNAQNRFEEAFAANERDLLIPRQQFIGKRISEVFSSEFTQQLASALSATRQTREPQTLSYTLNYADGIRHFSARLVPFVEDKALVVVQNVTEQIKAQEKSTLLRIEQERVKSLSQFIASATHHLGNILSVVVTNVHLMGKATDDAARQKRVEQVNKQIGKINTLLEALRVLVELDTLTQFTVERLNLNQFLEQFRAELSDIIMAKHIRLTIQTPEAPTYIMAAPKYFYLALWHVLENAATFTPEGGQITITVNLEDNLMQLRVTDTGAGIPAEHLSHVFDRFYRADSAGTTLGFGLGLPIAKHIIEGHHGKISIESTVGQGTSVTIELPALPTLLR